ncbi:MAG TPA: hypothetical protein PKV21_01300 [bacterium]|nr:hypothetical protein [bacterium]HOM26125.1 hypothetical protein [bacterium]
MENLEKELEKRKWPKRPEIHINFKKYNSYVTYGRVENRSLRLFQSLSEPIPPEECAITSLCKGKNRKIYGATSGKRSHLFYYSFSPEGDGVCDISIIEGAKSVKNSLCVDKTGKIWGGVSEGEKGYIFCYDTSGDHMGEGGTFSGEIKIISEPVPGEFIVSLICDEDKNVLYGISSESGYFFIYDITKNEVSIKGQIDKNKLFSSVLVKDNKGNVYFFGQLCQMFKYSPEEDKIIPLDIYAPCLAGRTFYNRVQSVCFNEYDGFIYGGVSPDGILFAYNPETNFLRMIGRVTPEKDIPCLTVGNDGIVYGISGEKDGMAHLFSYDPDSYSLKDLGLLYTTIEIPWHGYEFSSACTGDFGEIYLGESDRISHLFIYFPPIPKRKKIT